MTAKPGSEHLILFPFMAQGHITPFLALAAILEERTDFTITIVNTPLNVRAARAALPPTTAVRFAELPFDSSAHGLPPESENTDCLPYHLILKLMEASLTLRPAFEQLISDITAREGRHPLCIVSDFFFGWSFDVARRFGIFHSFFVSSGAYGIAIYILLWLHLPHRKTAADEFLLPHFPVPLSLHRSQLDNLLTHADGTDPWSLVLRPLLSSCLNSDGWLVNTIEEMETIGLKCLREMLGGLPLWPIGPVSSMLKSRVHSSKVAGINLDACVEWLNQQSRASVLYVSFGSMNTISASQMRELAAGLEQSGKPFIWVIRPPIGNDINGEIRAEWLPDGFEERIVGTKQGILVRRWAPQLEILSHESTGAFLSHCGWNSVIESLARGVPMIGWPLSGDQYYNSKMLEEEIGVCVEMTRTNRSELRGDHVAAVIELVMGETEKREDMRKEARRCQDMVCAAVREEMDFKGSSIRALDDFISAVHSARR